MKIKELREQPLLKPPGERRWWEVTEGDREFIVRNLGHCRDNQAGGLALAMQQYYMRGLDMGEDVTAQDLKLMWDALDERRKNPHFSHPEAYFFMRGLGINVEIRRVDRKKMLEELDSRRGWDSLISLTEHLYYLKELGVIPGATEEDKKAIREGWLRYQAGEGSLGAAIERGLKIAEMHHYMRGLGIQMEVSPRDMQMMREHLESLRKKEEWLDGREIVGLHYYMRQVLPPETQETIPVPPIKRIGR